MADLSQLDSRLIPLAEEFLLQCNAHFTTKITVTWRDPDAQGSAFDKGLSKAKAGQSPHNCCSVAGSPASRAFDFSIIDNNGHYITDGTDPKYTQAGEIAEMLGLFWAGRWTQEHDHCDPDYDHVQLINWKVLPDFSEILST